jgi:hypothetical protein
MEQARLDRPISWLDSLATAYQMPFYKNDSMSGPDIRSRYITALYFTLTTITSIGFGNVAAFTNGEKLFAIFAMMVGCKCNEQFELIIVTFRLRSLVTSCRGKKHLT